MADDESARQGPVLVSRQDPATLDEAIELIEAGKACSGICVDLGGGRLARADGREGLAGLLQRLRGHRLLTSMRDSAHAMSLAQDAAPQVVEPARNILDAIRALD